MKNISLTIAILFVSTASAWALESDDYGFPNWNSTVRTSVAATSRNSLPQAFVNTRVGIGSQARRVFARGQWPTWSTRYVRTAPIQPSRRATTSGTRTINVSTYFRGN